MRDQNLTKDTHGNPLVPVPSYRMLYTVQGMQYRYWYYLKMSIKVTRDMFFYESSINYFVKVNPKDIYCLQFFLLFKKIRVSKMLPLNSDPQY